MRREEESFMSIIMKKKRKEPINKIAIRLACSCKEHNTDKCPCGCTDTTPKYGDFGKNEATLCGALNLSHNLEGLPK